MEQDVRSGTEDDAAYRFSLRDVGGRHRTQSEHLDSITWGDKVHGQDVDLLRVKMRLFTSCRHA